MNADLNKITPTGTGNPDFKFALNQVMACPGCDLLLEKPSLAPGEKVICPRCEETLQSPNKDSINNSLVLAMTGLLLFPYAFFLPIMTLDTMGLKNTGTILDGVISTWNSGYIFVALILAATSIIFPLIKFVLIFCLSLNLKLGRTPNYLPSLMRTYVHLDEWGMLEVFMIGILVTIIKMHHMANIHYNTGFFCFVALMLIALGSSAVLDKEAFWGAIEPREGKRFQALTQSEIARDAGLALCHDCHKLVPLPKTGCGLCPRCGAGLHFRKPESLNRTWALVITALILTFPANILPIMKVNFLGGTEASTIMDGIIYFFQDGSYGIGLIILTASILVPCFKIIGLLLILLSIHFHWQSWLLHKAKLFRIIEFIGRWSMLDIFVISLLQVLVNFTNISSIRADAAAPYFAGVVLSTMFAAITFDPRLLWDA